MAEDQNRDAKTTEQPLVSELAERIALHVFPRHLDRGNAKSLENLLIDFANEIKRSAIEPRLANHRTGELSHHEGRLGILAATS